MEWKGGSNYFRLKTPPVLSVTPCQRRGNSFEGSRGPGNCAGSSLRRAWNTTRHRLGLGPDRTVSYPLLADRKPLPTVAGDCRAIADARGISSGSHHLRPALFPIMLSSTFYLTECSWILYMKRLPNENRNNHSIVDVIHRLTSDEIEVKKQYPLMRLVNFSRSRQLSILCSSDIKAMKWRRCDFGQ